MSSEPEDLKIPWNTLNLCIGSIFEVMQNKQDFTTSDVAKMLATHGVEVTGAPESIINRPIQSGTRRLNS